MNADEELQDKNGKNEQTNFFLKFCLNLLSECALKFAANMKVVESREAR
jgi:hypothetical protein